ncbi:MAG: hypothetical protein AAB948_00185 [Patescibacteria group bacterium]
MDTKRFNQPEYKSQIQGARKYKREVHKAPEEPLKKLLYYLGLDTWQRKTIASLIFVFFVYCIYFAPFLKLNSIEISGTDQQAASKIEENFNEYIQKYRVGIFPRKNIFFFGTRSFTDYLLENNYQVAAVIEIKRKPLHKVVVEINQRIPEFVLEQGLNNYVLNSDSTIGSSITSEQILSDFKAFKKVKDSAEEVVNPGEKFLNTQKNDFLQYLNDNIEKKMSLPIESFEVPGRASDQLIVHLKKGFVGYFNSTADPKIFLDRFYTLWIQLTPDQQNRLAYFDLRFEKNAYACFKGDKCASSNINLESN